MNCIRTVSALLLAACLTVSASAAIPNGGAESTVTEAMTAASYWLDSRADDLLMTADEIGQMNRRFADGSGTMVFDLSESEERTDADALRRSLSRLEVPQRDLYVGGRKLHNDSYYARLSRAILGTGFTGSDHESLYAIATAYAPVRAIPTGDIIGYSADDPDDEMLATSLLIGEPFLIHQRCTIGDKVYYWGYCTNLNGWVSADDVGLCASKEEWLRLWKTEPDGRDFLVIAQDHVTTEPSLFCPDTADVKLMLGTRLRLVPAEELPEAVGERGTWHNYVAYLPVRAEDGSLSLEPVLLSQHYRISLGYVPYTRRNALELAFSCLGDRYGWGNMLDSFDCSGFVRAIHRCFGLELPRNTTWQLALPETDLKLTGMTDDEKRAVLAGLPAGTPMYFSGHTMLLCGAEGSMPYVISDTGSLSDSTGELKILRQYSVIVNSLTARRRSGNTWLTDLADALILPDLPRIDHCAVSVQRTEGAPAVTVRDGDTLLTEGRDYTLSLHDDHVTVLAAGSYLGAVLSPLPAYLDIPSDSPLFPAAQWAVGKNIICSDTHRFHPERLCTRADLLTMLFRAVGTAPQDASPLPAGIAPDAYYAEAVRWASEAGLLPDADTFLPGGSVAAADLARLCTVLAANDDALSQRLTAAEPPLAAEEPLTRAAVLQALYALLR